MSSSESFNAFFGWQLADAIKLLENGQLAVQPSHDIMMSCQMKFIPQVMHGLRHEALAGLSRFWPNQTRVFRRYFIACPVRNCGSFQICSHSKIAGDYIYIYTSHISMVFSRIFPYYTIVSPTHMPVFGGLVLPSPAGRHSSGPGWLHHWWVFHSSKFDIFSTVRPSWEPKCLRSPCQFGSLGFLRHWKHLKTKCDYQRLSKTRVHASIRIGWTEHLQKRTVLLSQNPLKHIKTY